MLNRRECLQSFVDAAEAAYRMFATGMESKRAVERVFSALTEPNSQSIRPAARLPVCAHLNDALSVQFAHEPLRALVRNFKAIEPLLVWHPRSVVDAKTASHPSGVTMPHSRNAGLSRSLPATNPGASNRWVTSCLLRLIARQRSGRMPLYGRPQMASIRPRSLKRCYSFEQWRREFCRRPVNLSRGRRCWAGYSPAGVWPCCDIDPDCIQTSA